MIVIIVLMIDIFIINDNLKICKVFIIIIIILLLVVVILYCLIFWCEIFYYIFVGLID